MPLLLYVYGELCSGVWEMDNESVHQKKPTSANDGFLRKMSVSGLLLVFVTVERHLRPPPSTSNNRR